MSLDEGSCPCCRKKMSALEDLPKASEKEKEDVLNIYNDAVVAAELRADIAEELVELMVKEAEAIVAEQVKKDIAESIEELMAEEAEAEDKKRQAKIMGFNAFVKHCNDTIPEIAAISRIPEQRRRVNDLRKNDKVAYKKFITEWHSFNNIIIIS